MTESLPELITALQNSVSILDKQDIQTAANTVGQYVHTASADSVQLGDDCAAIPDGDGYLLLAAEGLWPQLVSQDPWFAGWCAVMVNISDIAAMGGTPIAVVDALWSQSAAASAPLWQGMQAAARAYNVPIVGGHTNCHSPYDGLAVAILGRAKQLITSFDAQPGDDLVMVVNMAGSYYGDYPFWNAATTAEPARLQRHIGLLPQLAARGLCYTGKDISMGGIAGTLLMLAEASGCGASLDLDLVPRPAGVPWRKWLTSFPSFGFLLSVPPEHFAQVQELFQPHGLTCKAIGKVKPGSQIIFQHAGEQRLFWDVTSPLTGFGKRSRGKEM
ncbi:sll0787 family AIR synthase-like protein [Leptolyngbya cf. ectocarpi LEGE 11479]|uniref:Sll0787 family AIR synthase-like protein n=1 Tax=Leptolyngbya cf. ectocarpi LEGE 11479 TaxID=1828722 RepID=A0A929FAN4_LEPEC|nr:sll0787 family AIR synthase-like protein [Leptolyngbya ectocarpi]MBE9070101.1 sll0787 family AIR synthase-like protein [Leptolyngbya cf. ectocarpi LEGE 11479]